jgi:hypothetical protein
MKKGFDLNVTQTTIGWFSWGLMRSSWNLDMLIFTEGGKPENPEKIRRTEARERTNKLPAYSHNNMDNEKALMFIHRVLLNEIDLTPALICRLKSC